MKSFNRMKTTAVVLVMTAVIALPSVSCATSYAEQTGVVTIYNRTSIHLSYQIRVWQSDRWGAWQNQTHKHPNGGWHYHSFEYLERIQIRFDRIGGDRDYTEKIYDLDFNTIVPYKERLCRHKGRAYAFSFDRGGRLLDLYKTNHNRR